MISNENLDKKFCVYLHINKINGKRYVGVTSQLPEKRWENGKGYTKRQPHMYNAIKKYGWDNFEHKILIDNISLEHADSLERMLIKAWRLQDPRYGYNSQSGGLTNATLADETRQKISKALIGRELSDTHRQNLSNTRKNTPLSEKQKEHIEYLKYFNKGKKFTESHKKNLSNALKGREFSETHKNNLSNAKKGQCSERQLAALLIVCENNIGRKHTEEEKKKISAGNKGKIKKNSVKVGQYNLNTEEIICVYDSIMDAHNKTGISYNNIWNCVNNKAKSAGGFNWRKFNN